MACRWCPPSSSGSRRRWPTKGVRRGRDRNPSRDRDCSCRCMPPRSTPSWPDACRNISRSWSLRSRRWTSRTSISTARPPVPAARRRSLIVSGPIADDIGMNADVNLFGPGNRANATIGRAVRLILRNVFQMIPGISDKSTQGSRPNTASASPSAAAATRGRRSARRRVTRKGSPASPCLPSGGFCNVENHGGNTPEQILRLGRRRDGELRLHHLGPERCDPRARAYAHRRRRRLEPRGRAVISLCACQAAGRGNEERRKIPRQRIRQAARRPRASACRSRVSSIGGCVPRIS